MHTVHKLPLSSLSVVTLAIVSFSSPLLAAPEISETHLNDENQLVIKGDGFGDGPNVALYDNFEGARHQSGETQFNPQIGKWQRQSSNSPTLSVERGNISTQSVIARQQKNDISTQLHFGIADSSGVHGLKHFQEVYFSYTIKDAGDFPGRNGGPNNFSDISSTKDAWMMFGYRGDNTDYAVSQGDPAGHDLYIPGWTGGGFNIAGNRTNMSPSYWQTSIKDNWDFGGWVTKMFHAKLDSDDPYGNAEGFFSYLNKEKYDVNYRNGNFMSDQTSDGVPYPYWDRIKFFAWLRQSDADVKRLIDEVYVAIGPNANARVVLTDSQNLKNSTAIFHLPPVNWESDEITVEIPNLNSGHDYYVHVANADNDFSSGINICTSCPQAPPGLSVE